MIERFALNARLTIQRFPMNSLFAGLGVSVFEVMSRLARERDAVNLGIYAANKLGDRPYSINEIAAMMGISKQAVHKRVQLGETVYIALETARSHGAVVRLDAMRQTRAMVLGQAGVPDRTGSPRELEAGS